VQKVQKIAAAAPLAISAPAFAAQEAFDQVALADVNILGVIATALFIIIPTSFLIILYVKSVSEGNVSGGFSQEYYDKSKSAGNKKTNEAAVLKGKGLGMRPSK
jgi:photosystem II PsbM protein